MPEAGRLAAAFACLLLTGCGRVLEFNRAKDRAELLSRADLVFVGVIERHEFPSWPWFRVSLPPDLSNQKYWQVLRRRVRIETILRGSEPRKTIDIYEVFWTGGTSGDWNLTWDGERALFFVRSDRADYRLTQDWWRSIFPVTSGPHSRMPLDETHSLYERIALMNWWIPGSDPTMRISYPLPIQRSRECSQHLADHQVGARPRQAPQPWSQSTGVS